MKPTLDDLYKLAQDQPVVHQAMTMYSRGDITLEHALMGMVLTLAEQLKNTEVQLLDCIQKQPPPRYIIQR